MFATIIIVLPCLYTGGQVHVSHSSSTKVFNLAPSSLITTSVLSWYTDVMHEVKPITSGYRLALSYNLIHTSASVPRPTLPNMHAAVSNLRHILRKWHHEAYAEDVETNLIAYLLKHQYSQANLSVGAAALKGEDAHLVAHLREIAEELGYIVCLANLSCNMTGYPEDDGGYRSDRGGWGKRRRYNWYDEDEDEDEDEGTPSMLEVTETTMTIENMADFDGHSIMGLSKLDIDSESLIPQDPFEGVDPDDTEYEGYQGNVSLRSTVSSVFPIDITCFRAQVHWNIVRLHIVFMVHGYIYLSIGYHRTVLVLYHEDHELDIFLSTGGISYALQRLKRKELSKPTADDRRVANWVIARLTARDPTTTREMAKIAIQWNDLEMWNKVVKASVADKGIQVLGKDSLIKAAWKKFSFETIRPMCVITSTFRCPLSVSLLSL